MVLPNASASAPTPEGGFNDSPPNDQYDFGNGDNNEGPHQNMPSAASLVQDSSLPRPCPGMGFFGYNQENLTKLVDVRLQQAAKIMGRAPSQEEASSLTYWTSKQISLISYGAPLGVGAGLYRAYTTREGFNFPFLKPNPEKFNPEVFITQKLNIFNGVRSRMAWHSLRSAAYGATGNFIGTMLFASYAMSVVAVGELSDKRLTEYVKSMKQAAEKAQGKLRERAGAIPPQTQQAMGRPGIPPSRVEEVDDASPTSGTAFWEENDNNLADKGWRSENDPNKDSAAARFDEVSTRKSREAARHAKKKQQQQADAFDDMSPTGGASITDEAPADGSAWDRIRRQNAGDIAPSTDSKYGDRND